MKKKTLKETNWGVFLLLLVAILLIVNYLGYRHYHRWDLTASGSFSLSPQTKKILKGVKSKLDVVVFLPPGDPLYQKVKDLLTAYETASPMVKVRYVNPDRDPAGTEALAKRYNVSVANVVVFASGSRSKYVEKDQMVDYDFSAMRMGGRPRVKAFKAEEAFTNAILDVLNPRKPVIYFTQGHGERSAGERNLGFGMLRERLKREGDILRNWTSLGKTSVPEDADCLVIAGPRKPFLPTEAKVVGDYLTKGGKVFALLDPVILPGRPPLFGKTGLEELFKEWGVEAGNDIVLDPAASVRAFGAQTFFCADYGTNTIVRDLSKNKYPVLFSLARSLVQVKPAEKGYTVAPLLMSSSKSWGLRSLKSLDKPAEETKGDPTGPLLLAACVYSSKPGEKTRIVITGDADLGSDTLLSSGAGNLLFCMNAFHWLLRQESRIAIPPKTSIEAHLTLTASQSNFLFILFVLIMPMAAVGTGVFVYIKRRR